MIKLAQSRKSEREKNYLSKEKQAIGLKVIISFEFRACILNKNAWNTGQFVEPHQLFQLSKREKKTHIELRFLRA